MDRNNFEELINNEFLLVEFIPADCDSCDDMLNILEEIQNEDSDIVVARMDVEKNQDFLDGIGLRIQDEIPTVLLFSNGDVQDYIVGMETKESIIQKIEDIKSKIRLWAEVEAGEASFFESFDFTLHDLDGNEVTVSKIGGLVILDFWATWCPPCKAEIPYLVDFYNTYKNRSLTVIGVSSETPEVLNDFVKNFSTEIIYPILVDKDREISSMFGIRSIPTTFFIAPDGTLIKKEVGFSEESVPEFQKIIEENLPKQ